MFIKLVNSKNINQKPEGRNKKENSPTKNEFFKALNGKPPEDVKLMISKDRNLLMVKNEKDFNAAYVALQNKNMDLAMFLIEQMTHEELLTTYAPQNDTIFHAAAYMGENKLLQLLIKKAPQLLKKVTATGQNALHAAARGGCVETLEFLLSEEVGMNLNSTDNYGRNALFYANFKGQNNAAKFLYIKGINLNQNEKDIKPAIETHILEKLVKNSEEFENSKRKYSRKIVSEEIKSKESQKKFRKEIFLEEIKKPDELKKYLSEIESGEDIIKKFQLEPSEIKGLFKFIIKTDASSMSLKIFQYFLDNGLDKNTVLNNKGMTLLKWSIAKNNIPFFEALLRRDTIFEIDEQTLNIFMYILEKYSPKDRVFHLVFPILKALIKPKILLKIAINEKKHNALKNLILNSLKNEKVLEKPLFHLGIDNTIKEVPNIETEIIFPLLDEYASIVETEIQDIISLKKKGLETTCTISLESPIPLSKLVISRSNFLNKEGSPVEKYFMIESFIDFLKHNAPSRVYIDELPFNGIMKEKKVYFNLTPLEKLTWKNPGTTEVFDFEDILSNFTYVLGEKITPLLKLTIKLMEDLKFLKNEIPDTILCDGKTNPKNQLELKEKIMRIENSLAILNKEREEIIPTPSPETSLIHIVNYELYPVRSIEDKNYSKYFEASHAKPSKK